MPCYGTATGLRNDKALPRCSHKPPHSAGRSCSVLLGSLGGFVLLYFPQTQLRHGNGDVQRGRGCELHAHGGGGVCVHHSHCILGPRKAAASRQLSGLVLRCGTAGPGTEQSQHAAILSHSSSSNTLTSWLASLFSRGTSSEKEREKSFQTTILGKT